VVGSSITWLQVHDPGDRVVGRWQRAGSGIPTTRPPLPAADEPGAREERGSVPEGPVGRRVRGQPVGRPPGPARSPPRRPVRRGTPVRPEPENDAAVPAPETVAVVPDKPPVSVPSRLKLYDTRTIVVVGGLWGRALRGWRPHRPGSDVGTGAFDRAPPASGGPSRCVGGDGRTV